MVYLAACISPLITIPKKFFVAIDFTKHKASFREDDLRSGLAVSQSCRVPLMHWLIFIISGKRTMAHRPWSEPIGTPSCEVTKTNRRAKIPVDVRACMVAA